MVKILYFGKLADLAGQSEEQIDLPDTVRDSAALRQWLDTRFDAGGALLEPTIRIAVDAEIVIDPHTLIDATEIALMPPVGGG